MTVVVVAVGVALFEIALLPGMAIGVAAMLGPKYLLVRDIVAEV
jgi:hypothetical protein